MVYSSEITTMCPAPWNNDPLPPQFQQHELNEPYAYSTGPMSESEPMRAHAASHPTVDAPICIECQALELTFFDPGCAGCKRELLSTHSTIAHVFAVLRQWVPQVQQSIEFLIEECLRRGAHPDDRDQLTDMTLLMYACKAGAHGVGDVQAAARVSRSLLSLGADANLKCSWTSMSALHYAAYFDVSDVIEALLRRTNGADVDTPCPEYENGTALHIAAANLSLGAAKVLLRFGADKAMKDDLARMPEDCIPEEDDFSLIPEAEDLITQMVQLLRAKEAIIDGEQGKKMSADQKAISGRIALQSLGLKVGDRVLVAQSKLGSLRYCGTTSFATGLWAGVALDEPQGKHDGTVHGVMYFKCKSSHGVFVPVNKVAKVGSKAQQQQAHQPATKPRESPPRVHLGKVDVSHVESRLTNALTVIEARQEIKVGDRVTVSGLKRHQFHIHHTKGGEDSTSAAGTVRFIGRVDFTKDDQEWYGVELDLPLGRHDGTVQGVRYFAADQNTGVFVDETKLRKMLLPDEYHVSRAGESLQQQQPVAQQQPQQQALQHEVIHRKTSNVSVKSSASLKPTEPPPMSTSPTSLSISVTSLGSGSTKDRKLQREAGWQTVSAVQFNKFKKKEKRQYLEVGMGAICVHNKEMGVVRFVGRVDFATGIWVGLEMRRPIGKHDGVVQGKRYFQTKANHGVLLRPKKISVHGINGDNLLKPESEYPF